MKRKMILVPVLVFLMLMMSAGTIPFAHAEPYGFILKWGSQGTGDGQFLNSRPIGGESLWYYPFGVAVDSLGNVYVVDSDNYRVEKFDSNGNFLSTWGSRGTGDGQFGYPGGVAVDSAGNVYVTDDITRHVDKFDSNGNFLSTWGSRGSGDGQFESPHAIAFDSLGNVYVVDTYNYRVEKFDSNGNFLLKWGTAGSGDEQFYWPSGVAVDNVGNVYVTDYNHRVEKFDSNGNFLSKWGSGGQGDGQVNCPGGVAVDNAGNVYVADSYNHRAEKFDSNGNFLCKWGSLGSGDGQFFVSSCVAVDILGNVYVTDYYNYRVQKFSPAMFGGFLQPINTDGSSIFKAGSTVPVKFQLKDTTGAFMSTAIAKITYAKLTGTVLGNEFQAVSTAASTTGNLFRYDLASNQYIFNLSTKALAAGTYQITVKLDDGTSYSVNISLK